MTEIGHLLADDVVVCVKGRLDLRDEVPKIVCSELKRPQLTSDGSEPLQVVVPVNALDDSRVERLRELLRDHPGRPRCTSMSVPKWSGWPTSTTSR